jgi:hypothetical protein
VEKNFREQGTTLKEFGNKLWTDRRYGFGVMISGAVLTISIFFIIWILFLGANSLMDYPLNFTWHPFAICLFIAYSICHRFVFRNEKYIRYFKKFDRLSHREKRRYGLLSLSFIVVVMVFLILSFGILPPLP